MADNRNLAALTGNAACDEVPYSGDTSVVQLTRNVHVTGAEGSKVVNEVYANDAPAVAAYGAIVRHVPSALPYHVVAAASQNAANIKPSAGVVRKVSVFCLADYPIYVKFHNTAVAPTPGVAVAWTVAVQAGQSRDVVPPGGAAFSSGIGITIVKGIANADATALVASDCVVDVFYE
jgi:hypothetical protein